MLKDEDLLRDLSRGNDQSFDVLYTRYRNRLVAFAGKRLKSTEVAEEIVQDVFADLWDRRHSIVINSSFEAYIHVALRNRIIDFIRRSKLREQYITEMLASTTEDSQDASFREHLYTILQHRIDGLPKRCREVFELSRFQAKTNKEIAAALNISPETAKFHISHALRVLRSDTTDILSVCLAILLM